MSAMDGLTAAGASMGKIMGLTQANAFMGVDPGWFWKAGGWIANGMVKGMTQLMPDAISSAVSAGLDSIDFGSYFASAFSHPFAGFQLNMEEARLKWEKQYTETWGKASQAASQFSKIVGLSEAQMVKLRDEMKSFADDEKIGIKFNKSIEEATLLQQKYTLELGRQVSLTDKQKVNLIALSSVMGSDEAAVKFTSALDKFGISTTGAGEMMTKMFNKSVKQGLVLEKYAKNVTDHLSLAQKYTFKDGTKGLMNMAELATKIKMDMGMVAQFADKVSNVSDAINMGAQLQVLGGPFAEFGNPLRMLYGSLNDMEDFGERFAKLTENLGSFNKQTGEFNIKSTFDRIRLKEASKVMGVDYEKLIDQATTQARRAEVEKAMAHMTNIPKEFKEWVKNNATFEKGVAGIKGKDGTFKALSQLGKADFEQLINDTKSEAENIADIAEMLRGHFDKSQGRDKQKDVKEAEMHAQRSEEISNLTSKLGADEGYLSKLVELQDAVNAKNLMKDYASPIMNTLSSGLAIAANIMLLRRGGGGRFLGKAAAHDKGGIIPPSAGRAGQEYLSSIQPGESVMTTEWTKNNGHLVDYMNAHPHKKIKMYNGGGLVGGDDYSSWGNGMISNPLGVGIEAGMTIPQQHNWAAAREARATTTHLTKMINQYDEASHKLLQSIEKEIEPIVRESVNMGTVSSGSANWTTAQKLDLKLNQLNKAHNFVVEGNLQQAEGILSKLKLNHTDDVLTNLKNTQLHGRFLSSHLTQQGPQIQGVFLGGKPTAEVLTSKGGGVARQFVTAGSDDALKLGISESIETIAKTATQTATQTATKSATATALKTASKVGSKFGGHAFGGLVSGGFRLYNANEDGRLVNNRYHAFWEAGGSAAGTTIGSVLGGYAGPVGSMAGGMIGDEVGAAAGIAIADAIHGSVDENLEYRYKVAKDMKNQLGKNKFSHLKGSFYKSELEDIAEALDNNGDIDEEDELSDYLIEKLQNYGNDIVLHKGKYKNGGWKDAFKSIGSKIKKGISRFINGPSHESGGVTVREGNNSYEYEGKELVASAQWVKDNPNSANKIANGQNLDIQAKERMGTQMKVNEQSSNDRISSMKLEMPPLKIDLSGVINLTGAVNSSIDSKDLEKVITTNIVGMIEQKIDVLLNKGWDKRRSSFKTGLPAQA